MGDSLNLALILGAGFVIWRELEKRGSNLSPGPSDTQEAERAARLAQLAAAQEAQWAAIAQARMAADEASKAKKGKRLGEIATSCVGFATGGAGIGTTMGPIGAGIGALAGCGTGVALELIHDQGWI